MELSQRLAQAFNAQYNQELVNANIYEQLSSLAESLAWDGFAKYLYGEVAEENKHANGFRKFMIDRNFTPRITAHPPQISDGKEPINWIQYAYGSEQANTKSILALCELCHEEQDYDAKIFLQDYVTIQRESERELFDLIQELQRCGSMAAVLIINERLAE